MSPRDPTTPLVTCVQCHTPLAPGEAVCPRCRSLQPSRESLAPAATIEREGARIVVETRIGEGGMGVVWRAWVFRAPGTPGAGEPELVALKVLRRDAMSRDDIRAMVMREAEVLRLLSHPNIVAYNDSFEHDGSLVLSMEYVDGETLEAVIARHVARSRLAGGRGLPCMPFLRAWYYFQQLLGALATIHALGIVHRDVKPSNIFVRHDGLVKLGDFGIARFADAPPTAATMGLAPGTGAYMSPEQVLSAPIDGRSDLYSAAIVLYEMLAGRTPFASDRSEFLIRKDQVEQRVPPIRTFLPQAPPVLEALFARALEKDAALRFESAIEMGDAFRAALGLQDTAEWRAQADIARTAKTIAHAGAPEKGVAAHEKKLATLREFVVRGYKTMKMASR